MNEEISKTFNMVGTTEKTWVFWCLKTPPSRKLFLKKLSKIFNDG